MKCPFLVADLNCWHWKLTIAMLKPLSIPAAPVYLDPFLYTSVWQTINQGTQHFRISKKECIQISSFVLLQLY